MESDSGSKEKNPRKRKRDQTDIDKTLVYFRCLGRQKNNKNVDVDMYECNLCQFSFNGTKKPNLKTHLKNRHHAEYAKVTNDQKEDSFVVQQLKLLQYFVEIVSVNGRPFKSLLDSGFQKIIEGKLNRLRDAGYGLSMKDKNLPEVKEHLHRTAEKVRERIKFEVKGLTLSLMVDIVTKNNRSILGVSLQYVYNGHLRIRSIGMIELHKSHTGVYLKEVITDRLKLYEIDLKQIIVITTDNGANVQKMVRDIEDCLNVDENSTRDICSNVSEQEHLDTDSATDESTDRAIAEILAQNNDVTDDEAISCIFDEVALQQHRTLLNDMTNAMSDDGFEFMWDISGINCAAHTLQLAIKDSFKRISKAISNFIELCRKTCKFFRLQTTRFELEEARITYIQPRLENDTRWGSMYLMVC